MPYARGPAVKKLSKMNTLLLARNYILLLHRSVAELRRLVAASAPLSLPGLPPHPPHHFPDTVPANTPYLNTSSIDSHQRALLKGKATFEPMIENPFIVVVLTTIIEFITLLRHI